MNEQERILHMVAEGKLSPEDGARLLGALRSNAKPTPGATPTTGATAQSQPRWLRIRVTDLNTGRQRVQVNLPLSLLEVGLRIGSAYAPELQGIDLNEVIRAIHSGASGRLVDVEDLDDGERIEIVLE